MVKEINLCPCGKRIGKCIRCIANKECAHGTKNARCKFCNKLGKTGLRLCLLTDYKQGEYKDEYCFCRRCNRYNLTNCLKCNVKIVKNNNYCNNCTLNFQKINRENKCVFCHFFDKSIGDRCKGCYDRCRDMMIKERQYEDDLKEKNAIRKIEVKELTTELFGSSDKSSSDLIEKFDKDNPKKIKKINKGLEKFKLILDAVSLNYTIQYFEKALIDMMFIFANNNKNYTTYLYETKIIICNLYSKEITKIFDRCETSDTLFIMLRILFFLIFRNPIIMKELIRECDIKEYLKNIVSKNIIDKQIFDNIKDIIQHIEAFGF